MLAVYAVLTVGLLAGRQRGVGGDEACRSAEPVSEHIGSVAALINGAEGVAFSMMKRARARQRKKEPRACDARGSPQTKSGRTGHCY